MVRHRRNPIVPEIRSALSPADVRRLEDLEATWRQAVREADAYYERGEYDLAAEMDVRAEWLAEQIESLISAVEEDATETDREADATYVPPDPNEYFASMYAAHVLEPSPTQPSARISLEYVAGNLRAYLQETYWSTGARFEDVTDEALLEAARDAYEARLALRKRLLSTAPAGCKMREEALSW